MASLERGSGARGWPSLDSGSIALAPEEGPRFVILPLTQMSQVAPALIVGIENAMKTDTTQENTHDGIFIDSQPVSETTYESPSLHPYPTISTPNTVVELALVHRPQSPPAPTPLSAQTPLPQSFQKTKNSLLENEYKQRQRRAEKINKYELMLLEQKIREAKAKADLAELNLPTAGKAHYHNYDLDAHFAG
ncbi:hypothetical protein JYU34_015129 [Plutella xylostella]|uniref:Uncharacterized protein n=1 Tax=Plutella xylostella TaxID=51655 RepID=A0ABQ7Q6I2_PLUXY|nr:hypothetical protein JYU34_015129 [Plutella xylostella]